jgi:hypothetical protein
MLHTGGMSIVVALEAAGEATVSALPFQAR